MVWGAVSSAGKSSLIFVDAKAKVNTQYYINRILRPFFQKDLRRLYPDGCCVFQQDPAPSHTSRKTIEYLNQRKIKYLPPRTWLANSPDCAPMDYGIWSYMKRVVDASNPRDLNVLKNAIRSV